MGWQRVGCITAQVCTAGSGHILSSCTSQPLPPLPACWLPDTSDRTANLRDIMREKIGLWRSNRPRVTYRYVSQLQSGDRLPGR